MSTTPQIHTCYTCGYQWEHGVSGDHDCSTRLRRRALVLSFAQESSGVLAADCAVLHQRNEAAKVEVVRQARELHDLRREIAELQARELALRGAARNCALCLDALATFHRHSETWMIMDTSNVLEKAKAALSQPAPEVVSKAEYERVVEELRLETAAKKATSDGEVAALANAREWAEKCNDAEEDADRLAWNLSNCEALRDQCRIAVEQWKKYLEGKPHGSIPEQMDLIQQILDGTHPSLAAHEARRMPVQPTP